MSQFWDTLDEYLGDGFDTGDIRAVVRRCWFFDFLDNPIRVWEGQGKLFTTDENEWLGIINEAGNSILDYPTISDGRDGSSATYNFTLRIPDVPGQAAGITYNLLRNEQSRLSGRDIITYLALFQVNEGLRPQTPIIYFNQLSMISSVFSEKIELDNNGTMVKKYSATIKAKDGNSGRSNVPSGTYADAIQKERARQLGVTLDRGCEFVALLANKTYQLP